MASNATLTCPAPFLPENAYPPTGGYLAGRFCGPLASDLSCCIPCPSEHWVYSDRFERNSQVAYWFNVPALICQVFLLLSFAVLPEAKSHRHYMSVGLCLSLMMIELGFIIPLGVKPDECHNAITPNGMHSDLTCAWSGALLEAGGMAAAVWILLRSLWTNMRVCWNIEHTAIYLWVAQIIGWGLPALFLTLTLSITGVSYRLGRTCVLNQDHSFVTWFGWLLAFACLAAAIQLATTSFSLWVFTRHLWGLGSSAGSSGNAELDPTTLESMPATSKRSTTASFGKRLAWRRVKKVLFLQWRSIVLSVFVMIQSVYFATVAVKGTKAARATKLQEVEKWTICLILHGGEKNPCLQLATGLGIDEGPVLASFFLSALIGLSTFALMVRWSMFVGWYELLRTSRNARHESTDDSVVTSPRRWRFGRSTPATLSQTETGDERHRQHSEMSGVLSDPKDSIVSMNMPEAGDVTARHATTDLFSSKARIDSQSSSE